MAELAGAYEAPVYGMLDVAKRIDAHDWGSLPKPTIGFHGQPADESKPTLLWDGEWEITYVAFRDMGAAFGRRCWHLHPGGRAVRKLPASACDPHTDPANALSGSCSGHWLLGAPFTATSMIGFIALAGIIVRNSILLVDFVRHGLHTERLCAKCCWRLARFVSSPYC